MNVHNPIKPVRSRADLLDQAREIADRAWSMREQTDLDRRLPDVVIDSLRGSGLIKLCRHRKWGGAEADPMTFLDVGREIARGSGSLGWIFSVLGFHEWYMTFASDELQAEVWGNEPDAMVCDSYATVGQIEKVADGYTMAVLQRDRMVFMGRGRGRSGAARWRRARASDVFCTAQQTDDHR